MQKCSESTDKPCICLNEIWKLWIAHSKGEDYETPRVPRDLRELIVQLTEEEMEALSDSIQDICYNHAVKNKTETSKSNFKPEIWQNLARRKLSPFRLKMIIELAKNKRKKESS